MFISINFLFKAQFHTQPCTSLMKCIIFLLELAGVLAAVIQLRLLDLQGHRAVLLAGSYTNLVKTHIP